MWTFHDEQQHGESEKVYSGSLFLQIWQLRKANLNQRLGSFPTKSRANILPRCRQNYPLRSPIIRGEFDGPREEKIGSKVSQKTCFFGFFTFLLSFSLYHIFSRWEPLINLSAPSTNDCSASPWSQILIGDRGNHREVFPLPSANILLLLLLLFSFARSSQHCHHFFHQHLL